jgi:hypothetical protein
MFAAVCLCACASAGPPRDVEIQFIDAETMKPIQGAYSNPMWTRQIEAGKIGTECVQAALLISDKNGWVRMKAPKVNGAFLRPITVMVPGYEAFRFQWGTPQDAAANTKYVTHLVAAEPQTVQKFVPWAKRLEALGYRHGHVLGEWAYYKIFPNTGFANNFAANKALPQRYFVKYRSFPYEMLANIVPVCNVLREAGRTDVPKGLNAQMKYLDNIIGSN